jgi:hypothetical protein
MAPLPDSEKAHIDSAKIRDYILSTEHPVGRFKAALFYHMGYNREKWEVLVDDIRRFHLPLDAELVERNKFGQKYSITGMITGPNGKTEMLRTIWIVLAGEYIPRFVTIYPAGG